MEIQQLENLVTTDFKKLYNILKSVKKIDQEAIRAQYDIDGHDIFDVAKRPDKWVVVDDAGSVRQDYVARLPIPLQKKIVSVAAQFLCGNPIELKTKAEDQLSDVERQMLEVIKKTWEDNKLDYESKGLAKRMMSECEVAELWYVEKAEPEYWKGTPNEGAQWRLRMKVISPSLGDTLYPVWNNNGDMIAFGRGYFLIDDRNKQEEHFDIYTNDFIYQSVKVKGGWDQAQPIDNIIGKIPVIYYSQDKPEWYDVQNMITRKETGVSNLADTNDYFGSPMVLVSGKVEGFAKKGERGKVLQLKEGAKVETLSWPQSPESVKLEHEILDRLIFDMTDTPDMSFQKMSEIGGNLTNFGVKMMFLPAHMKAAEKEETYGKSVQRRINLHKAANAKINVSLEPALPMVIKPKFEYYLPKNDAEKVDMLTTAKAGGILSTQTAVGLSGLVEDAAKEVKQIENDQQAESDLNSNPL